MEETKVKMNKRKGKQHSPIAMCLKVPSGLLSGGSSGSHASGWTVGFSISTVPIMSIGKFSSLKRL